MLLTCIDRANVDLTIRTAASITFKNVVKRCWESDEKINEADRQQVKVHIVKVENICKKMINQLKKYISRKIQKYFGRFLGLDHSVWPTLRQNFVSDRGGITRVRRPVFDFTTWWRYFSGQSINIAFSTTKMAPPGGEIKVLFHRSKRAWTALSQAKKITG